MQLNAYLCNKLRRWAAPQPLGDEGDACLRVCTTSSWNCQLKRLRVSESRAMLAFALLSVSISIINSQIAIRDILYLVEGLAFATDLKQMCPIHKEITRFWIANLMTL